MKRCYKCGETKPLDEFHKNKVKADGRATYCKSCAKTRNREYYLATPERNPQRQASRNRAKNAARTFVWMYLMGHPCVDCGVTDTRVLQFDHVRGEKSYDVAVMVQRGMSTEAIAREIEKCAVRCANCHTIVTGERGGWWRYGIHALLEVDDPQ